MGKKSTGDKPEPPKRPLTAFFIYKADVYDDVKKDNPSLKMTELTKLISEKWGKVDASTKTKYEKKNEEAKEKYEQEKQDYIDKYGEIEKKTKKSKKGDDEGKGKKKSKK